MGCSPLVPVGQHLAPDPKSATSRPSLGCLKTLNPELTEPEQFSSLVPYQKHFGSILEAHSTLEPHSSSPQGILMLCQA